VDGVAQLDSQFCWIVIQPQPRLFTIAKASCRRRFASSHIPYTLSVRNFVLAVPVAVARQSFDAISQVLGRTNSDLYCGFEPGTLRVVGWVVPEESSGQAARIRFESRTAYTAVGELREVHDIVHEFEMRNRVAFSELPGGEWRELPSSFEYRVVYSNSMGEVIA